MRSAPAISSFAADSSELARATMCRLGLILRAESTTKTLATSELTVATRPFAHRRPASSRISSSEASPSMARRSSARHS